MEIAFIKQSPYLITYHLFVFGISRSVLSIEEKRPLLYTVLSQIFKGKVNVYEQQSIIDFSGWYAS